MDSDNNNNNQKNHNTSSVDYFLLFDHQHPYVPPSPPLTDQNEAPATLGGGEHTTSTSTGPSRHSGIVDSESTTPANMMIVTNSNVSRELSPQMLDHSAIATTVTGNRCRSGSHHTQTSTSTGLNTVSGNHNAAGSAVGVEEQIYFDHDVVCLDTTATVPSTLLERGESSYSLLVSSSPTTPFLATTSDQVVSTSRHANRNRLYSNGSSSHNNRRRSSSNQEYYSNTRRRHIDTPELSGLNILNALTYAVHIVIWWTCGVWGMDHHMYTHWEQTQQHETLITPATWAVHYLWVPIMIMEAIFTVAQLLPHYRARPIITSGTSYFFFYTVLLQITYTLLFGFGLFVFSFISIVLALFALLSLLTSQQYHGSASSALPPSNRGFIRALSGGQISNGRWLNSHHMIEYVLFSFPFYLHTGWLILMAVDHFSLLFRRYNSAIDAQLASDIVGLGVLLVAAIYALNQPMAMGPDFVIPTVILWSYVRIHVPFEPIFLFVRFLTRYIVPNVCFPFSRLALPVDYASQVTP